jgi:hypothetical protein
MRRKIMKHQYTLDKQSSTIKAMDELKGCYFGEVRAVENGNDTETGYLAFLVRDGKINISDCLNKRTSKFDFTYDILTGEYRGRGTVNFYRSCERFVAYVLLMLDGIENSDG